MRLLARSSDRSRASNGVLAGWSKDVQCLGGRRRLIPACWVAQAGGAGAGQVRQRQRVLRPGCAPRCCACRERGCGDRGCPTDALELLFDLASARWRSPPAGEGSWALLSGRQICCRCVVLYMSLVEGSASCLATANAGDALVLELLYCKSRKPLKVRTQHQRRGCQALGCGGARGCAVPGPF